MESEQLSPLRRALTVLRSAMGWSQADLARANGVQSSVISDYERGPRNLTREKLDELVRLLGLPPEAVDCALSFVQSLHAAAEAPGYPDPAAEDARRQIEALAAESGRMMTDFTRSLLSRLTVHARALTVRQQAPVLWRLLKRHPTARRRVLIEGTQEYRSWGLCELLCAESVKAAADDADRAVELADLAVVIADLAPGEEAFARARQLWQAGTPGDPGLLSEAQVFSLEASLRISQERLPEAASLLDEALAADPGDLRTNLLIQRARLLEWAGEYEAALATLRQVAPRASERLDRRQALMLRFNPAWNQCHLGRFDQAEALLPEIQAMTSQLDNGLDALRLRWLEGRIAGGLGRSEEALAALTHVKRRFAELGIAYDAALATLELAVLYLEQGRTREVKLLARQLAPIFRAQGVHKGALVALSLFCEAAEKEAATVELARQVVEYLYRAQHNPQLAFEPDR